jgi:hypothetical protein
VVQDSNAAELIQDTSDPVASPSLQPKVTSDESTATQKLPRVTQDQQTSILDVTARTSDLTATSDPTLQVIPISINEPTENCSSILIQTTEGDYILEHELASNPILIIGNDVYMTRS